MRQISFLNLRAEYVGMKSKIDEVAARVLDSRCYIVDVEIVAFELDYGDLLRISTRCQQQSAALGANCAIGVCLGRT
jgi:hypothetical protein